MSDKPLTERLKDIKALFFDMDGVLTDGRVLVMPNDELVRSMHVRDGSAMVRAIGKGFTLAIISAGYSEPAIERFKRFGLQHIYMNAKPKMPAYEEILEKEEGLHPSQILYVGDDIADMKCLYKSGISVCPNDACQDVLGICDYVTKARGGYGVVREVIEMVLRAQKLWELPELK